MNIREQHAVLLGDMPDVQASADARRIPIQRVGIKGVRYPLRWRAGGGAQPSVGMFNLYVALPAEQKGTHMSRFVELLEARVVHAQGPLDASALVSTFREMLGRLDAARGRLEVSFPLFVRKTAPVSGVESLLDYEVSVTVDGDTDHPQVTLTVAAPVTSLCPCSKTISEYGAHNQRSVLTITIRSTAPVEPEELITIAEDEASCQLYGLLKRVDEKFVTERAYDNPKFVEDLARDVAARLGADRRVESYTVEAENFESIHNHSAYARIDSA